MVSKIAEKITSKNKSFLVLELGVAQLFSHKLAQSSSYMFLPSKTGGDDNQQVSNLEKSVSGAAATTLSSYSRDICRVVGGLKIMHKE
jgi:hypothetical protein